MKREISIIEYAVIVALIAIIIALLHAWLTDTPEKSAARALITSQASQEWRQKWEHQCLNNDTKGWSRNELLRCQNYLITLQLKEREE
jgi:hypothetical protein